MPDRPRSRRVARVVAALLGAAVAVAGSSHAAAAELAELKVKLDFPAQDLSSALTALGREIGTEIAFSPEAVRDKKAPAVHGEFEREQALKILLQGSGLTYRTTSQGAIVVTPSRAEAGLRMNTAQADPTSASEAEEEQEQTSRESSDSRPATAAELAGQTTDRDVMVLQEVVVTARKREEKLLEVPAPVSAISALTLERTKAERLEEYLTQVPGVTFDTGRAGQTKVTFRGINVGDSNATTVTYVDNTPVTPAGPNANSGFLTPNLDPSDLAMIEVDRGPQGTLYGANAIGGILKYVTVKPDPNNFSGRFEVAGVSAEHGDEGGLVRGAVNIPLLADRLGLRVSAFGRDDPGYIDDPGQNLRDLNGVHVSGGRGALLWNVTDSVSVNLAGMVQRMSTNGTDSMDYDPFTRRPLYGDLTHARYIPEEWFKSRDEVYSADIQWDLPWAQFLSSSSYSTLNNGGSSDFTNAFGGLAALEAMFGRPNLGSDQPLIVDGTKFTQELRLTSSGTSRLEWQTGAFFTRNRTRWAQAVNLLDIPSQEYVRDFGPMFEGSLNNEYDEYAAFGHAGYQFSPEFDLSVGVRYSNAKQRLRAYFEGALLGPTLDFDESEDENDLTWDFNPRYRLSEDSMAYMRIATGYRPGGVAVMTADALAAGLSPIFTSDHVINYELGWKASLFDRRVTADLSAYYIRWTDMQESITLNGFTFLSNGGVAHSQGIEAAFTWLPFDGLNLTANLTYNETRMDKDAQANPDLSQSGSRLPGTPEFSGNFTADYNWSLTSSVGAFMGASIFTTSARPNALALGYDPTKVSGVGPVPNFGNVPIYDTSTNEILGYSSTKLPGYTTVDLRAGLEYGSWTMQAYVKNLTDERIFSSAGGPNNTPSAEAPPTWVAVVLRPRTVGLSLAWKF